MSDQDILEAEAEIEVVGEDEIEDHGSMFEAMVKYSEDALRVVNEINQTLEESPLLVYHSDGEDFKVTWLGEILWDLESELWVDSETEKPESIKSFIVREMSTLLRDIVKDCSGYLKEEEK